MEIMEINGKVVTRDDLRSYLKSKRTILWMDWIITDPKQLEKALDWFMDEVGSVAAAAA